MAFRDSNGPALGDLMGRLGRTGLSLLHNRAELLTVEWQEEKARLFDALVRAIGLLFLGLMAVLMLTATIILLVPAEYRIYAAAGFALIYAIAAVAVWASLKSRLKEEPFTESREQVKKDVIWLNSLK